MIKYIKSVLWRVAKCLSYTEEARCLKVNILGGSVHTVKKNAEALVVATKEIELEVNAHKTKYMTVSRDQNAGRIHSMKMDNSSIERVEEFKYLGTTLTNQMLFRKKLSVDWS